MNAAEGIQKWLKFGLSAEQEDRFRQANFGGDIAQARIFVLLIILPFVVLLVNDYGFFGLSQIFYGLLVLRIAFAAYTILFLKSLREFSNYRSYDRAEFFWGLFLALANTAINATRPENFVAHTIVTVLAVFVIVLAIPNRFTNQVILALVYTIGQTLIIVPSLWISPQASFTVLLSMLMANAIAIASSWLLHFWRRREFLVHEEIQKARVETEIQRARLQAVIDSLPVGLWITDATGKMVFINDIASKIWGGTAPSAKDVDEYSTYKAWWEETGEPIAAENMPLARAIRDETLIEKTVDFERFDGTHGTQLVSSAPIKTSDGTIVGGVAIVQDITERKRVEEALKKSEKGLAEAQRIAHLGNWEWDIVTNELDWSDEIYRIFGLSLQEFGATYDAFLSYIHPDDRDFVNNAVKEALNGKPYTVDHRIVLANGEERIVHEQGEVIFDDNSTPVLMRGIVQDITERKKAEEELSRSERMYRSIGELIPYGIWETDPEGGVIYLSQSFLDMIGKSLDEVLEFGWLDHYPPEKIPKFLDDWKRTLAEGTDWHYEHPIRDKNGEWKTILSRGFPMRDDSGKIISWVGINLDITERKKAEEALRESEERFRVALQGSRVVMFSQDLELRYTWVYNPSPGFKAEDILGKRDYDIYQPEDTETFVAIKREVLTSGTGRRDEVITHRPTSAGGNLVHEMTTEPLRDATGAIIGVIGVAVDITERKRAEEAMAKIDIARQKEIHHRIKNNLQVISSLLDLAAERFSNRECIQDSEVLKAFKESQDRVISMALIHEELYKGEGFETLNFSPYIQELTESLFQTYKLTSADISLNMDLEENIFFNMDIAVPLGIIINELVSNSLKHAFIGRDKGEIRIKLYREENGECISSIEESGDCNTGFVLKVSDNGVGIPENLDIEELDSLGMQLVTSLVDQIDEELELKSDHGTEFTIRFTVKEKNNQASPLPTQQLVE